MITRTISKTLIQDLIAGRGFILNLHVTLSKVIANVKFLVWYQTETKTKKSNTGVSNKCMEKSINLLLQLL